MCDVARHLLLKPFGLTDANMDTIYLMHMLAPMDGFAAENVFAGKIGNKLKKEKGRMYEEDRMEFYL
jgi:hypothetical protein